ncbi:hypothetical protein [Taibaiella koreensis]|uniref:hypothetical protein n=1 Tax=Taibaiella koreensis TaxID=1268548 RepID=UPI000E59CF69|nr:hypothetical protein [Taibaiella koreensis]
MFYRFVLFFSLLLLAACSGTKTDPATSKAPATVQQWQPPATGAQVAQYKERVKEDNLNEKYFRITVIATEASPEGNFKLKLEYGFNINETDIMLPEWTPGVVLKPVLQKAEGDYHCLLGFEAGDGIFHELYDIRAENGNVRMKQTKGYFKAK